MCKLKRKVTIRTVRTHPTALTVRTDLTRRTTQVGSKRAGFSLFYLGCHNIIVATSFYYALIANAIQFL